MLRLFSFVVLAAMVSSGTETRAAGPATLRTSWLVVPASIAPFLKDKPDIASHLGKSYTPETTHFTGTAPMITGLAADEIDIAPPELFRLQPGGDEWRPLKEGSVASASPAARQGCALVAANGSRALPHLDCIKDRVAGPQPALRLSVGIVIIGAGHVLALHDLRANHEIEAVMQHGPPSEMCFRGKS